MVKNNICKILTEIRQMITDESDIPYVTAYCRYRGNCKGTCPTCEAELAYLERAWIQRQKEIKRKVVIGILVAILVGIVLFVLCIYQDVLSTMIHNLLHSITTHCGICCTCMDFR